MNSQKGIWEVDGVAYVDPNNTNVIRTKDGQGITHFSTIYAAPIAPKVSQIGAKDVPGADTFNGALTTSVKLPGYNLFGQSFAPTLIYNSSWVNPQILVSNLFDYSNSTINFNQTTSGRELILDYTTQITGSSYIVPTQIQATFYAGALFSNQTFGGGQPTYPNGQPVQFDDTGIARFNNLGSPALPVVFSDFSQNFVNQQLKAEISYAVAATGLQSGVTPYLAHYEAQFDAITVGTSTTHSVNKLNNQPLNDQVDNFAELQTLNQIYPSDLSGLLYIQNKMNSAAGNGWKIGGVQTILNPTDNRVVIEEGDGSITTYALANTIQNLYQLQSPPPTQHGTGRQVQLGTSAIGANYADAQAGAYFSWPNVYLNSYAYNSGYRDIMQISLQLGAPSSSSPLATISPQDAWTETVPESTTDSRDCNVVHVQQDYPLAAFVVSGSQIVGISPQLSAVFGGQLYGSAVISNNQGTTTFPSLSPKQAYLAGSYTTDLDVEQTAGCGGVAHDPFGSGLAVNIFCSTQSVPLGGNLAQNNCTNPPYYYTTTNANFQLPVNAGGWKGSIGINAGAKAIVQDFQGRYVIADYSLSRILRYDPSAGTLTLIAGTSQPDDAGDFGSTTNPTGNPLLADIYHPRALLYDSTWQLYIATDNTIRKIDQNNVITTVAGQALSQNTGLPSSAPALQMPLNKASGLALDESNQFLYVSDTGNHRVLQINLQTLMATEVAGNHTCGAAGDNGPALSASVCTPTTLGLDDKSNLLIYDQGNSEIRRVVFQHPSSGQPLAFNPTVLTDHSQLTQLNGTWTRKYMNGDVVTFDSQGRETSKSDTLGRTFTYVYDPDSGNLTDILDPTSVNGSNRGIHFDYQTIANGQSRLFHCTVPGKPATTFNYNGDGTLKSVSYADGTSRSFAYNENLITAGPPGILTSQKDELQNQTTYSYNQWNRIQTITRADSSQVAINDSGSGTAANNYSSDSPGTLAPAGTGNGQIYDQVTDANQQTFRFLKNSGGLIASFVDPLKDATVITYNSMNQPLEIQKQDPNGNIISDKKFTYDTTTSTHQGSDLLLSTEDILAEQLFPNVVSSQTYDTFGNVATRTTPNNYGTSNVFTNDLDPVTGVLNGQTDAAGYTVGYKYNGPFSLVSSVKRGTLAPATYGYDSLGNLTGVADPTQTLTDPSHNYTSYAYEPTGTGRVQTVTDPRGNVTYYTYDLFDRIKSVTTSYGTASPKTTSYEYWATGQLKTVTDALNNTIQYEYDNLGRLYKKTDQLGNKTLYRQYDGNNNLQWMTDPNGNDIHLSYDALNRLHIKTLPDDVITYEYDNNNHLLSASNSVSEVKFHYDPAGHMDSAGQQGLASNTTLLSGSISYTYDADGNRKKMTDPFGTTTSYYDAADHLSYFTNPRGDTFTFGLDTALRVNSISRLMSNGNSINTAVGMDDANFVQSLTHQLVPTPGTPQTLASYGYVKNNDNTKSSVTINGFLQNIGYNSEVELASEDAPQGAPSASAETFHYDNIGNRKTDNLGNFTYDSYSQRLTEDYNYYYYYDNNGNLKSRQAKTSPLQPQVIAGEVINYSYSSQNQLMGFKVYSAGGYDPTSLISTSSLTPTKTVSYIYDALGRRLQKTVVISAGTPSTTISNYLYDGSSILAEYDGSGNALARFTHSQLATDDVLAVQTFAGSPSPLSAAPGSFVYLKDSQGSVIDVVDDSGNEIQHYAYSSYGIIWKITNGAGTDVTRDPPLQTAYSFTGREYDVESGLYFFRARYYNPNIGRMLQEDPSPGHLAIPVSTVNSYVYSLNNPSNLVDPSGMDPDNNGQPAGVSFYNLTGDSTLDGILDAFLIGFIIVQTFVDAISDVIGGASPLNEAMASQSVLATDSSPKAQPFTNVPGSGVDSANVLSLIRQYQAQAQNSGGVLNAAEIVNDQRQIGTDSVDLAAAEHFLYAQRMVDSGTPSPLVGILAVGYQIVKLPILILPYNPCNCTPPSLGQLGWGMAGSIPTH